MSYLENAKQYTGSDLETIFFRPMLTGASAQDLGVRVLYNLPAPTTVQLWDGQRNILQKYDAAGWTGGAAAAKYQKTGLALCVASPAVTRFPCRFFLMLPPFLP